jgi:O-antigen/teichoic acid export membrane protein
MNLVAIKLIEVFSRALFTVGVTYLLAIDAAGQFGLANTLIGLFAFAFGWERHLDIQRRLAGHDSWTFDRAVRALPKFWAFNYGAMVPLLLVLTVMLARLDWRLSLVVALIAICEQVGNAVYNLSVIDSRYRSLVAIVAAKSAILALAVASAFLFAPSWLRIDFILWLWAGVASGSVVAMGFGWFGIRHLHSPERGSEDKPALIHTKIFDQHRASFTHFITGALAVLIIQIDRLVVGSLLPLDSVGLYFRHVVIVSFAYQFFNVASYNRKLAQVFKLSREGDIDGARRTINREYLMVVMIVVLGFAGGALLDVVLGQQISQRLMLRYGLIAILLAASVIRIYADFYSLILNGQFKEKRVLRNQMLSFVAGFASLVGLTLWLGVYGTALGSVLGSVLYLGLNHRSVRSISKPEEG